MTSQLEGKRPPTDIVLMELLSREYGWTPTEIRELKVSDIRSYLQIIQIRNKIESKKMKKYGRK